MFLIEGLPEPLTPASSHLQLFDNYIKNTRLRLRKMRDPSTKTWIRLLQQRFRMDEGHGTVSKLAEIYLNDIEYAAFDRLIGREIRKNRYFHEVDLVPVAFDVFLGPLWGLNTARVDFETQESMADYTPPPIFIFEVSNVPFFFGENLVEKNFADVQTEVAKIGHQNPA